VSQVGTAPRWDFLVSYATEDRLWAEWVGWTLEEAGYSVLIEAWDMVPGQNRVARMHDGTRWAARTVAVLSPAYLRSILGKLEWQVAFQADPEGATRRLVPVRVASCEPPGLLAQIVVADLFALDEQAARNVLLNAANSAIVGRAKPSLPPGFPGSLSFDQSSDESRPMFPGLPPVWHLPRGRNGRFIGREEILSTLAASLSPSGSSMIVQSVRGMGGVGKTEVATEYAYRFAHRFDIVWWVAAEDPVLIETQIARAGSKGRSDASIGSYQ
jgi:hypothetical protein